MPFTKNESGANSGSQEVVEVAIDAIAVRSRPSRPPADDSGLGELAAAIRRRGMVQPIIVRPCGNAYELVAGERRLRAARLAGLRKVPAVVREVGPREAAVLELIENLEREDLDVIEEARSYRRLLEEFKFTQSEVGQLVGKGQSTIANKLRLLQLPAAVQARIQAAGVSERHARALLELTDEGSQLRVLEEIIQYKLSVRQTEQRIRVLSSGLGTLAAQRPVGAVAGRGLRRGPDGTVGPGGSGGVGRAEGPRAERPGPTAGPGPERAPVGGAERLGAASDRRAIRAFRDVRLFLNTFRRAVEMLREAGVRAELTESDGPEYLEVKVIIPKSGPPGVGSAAPRGVAGGRSARPEGRS